MIGSEPPNRSPEAIAESEISVVRAESGEVTTLLKSWADGNGSSQDRLFELVYPEMRKIASQRLYRESLASIQVTELVHETYLRLVDQTQVDWRCRAQFFALAATMVRRILVDRARSRSRDKRGDGVIHVALDLEAPAIPGKDVDLIALDDALIELRRVQATAVAIIELRFFGGQSVEETAQILGLGKATVVRKWRFAKAWLAGRLEVRA